MAPEFKCLFSFSRCRQSPSLYVGNVLQNAATVDSEDYEVRTRLFDSVFLGLGQGERS